MTTPKHTELEEASRTAFITGITGQDGYYLTRLLIKKGYRVHGIVRRASAMNRGRIDLLKEELPHLADRITMHYGDVTDAAGIIEKVVQLRPDEIYNLAAQSHVRVSFDKPCYTFQVNADGALNVLEAARILSGIEPVRLYQASTSEMFGGLPGTVPQNEETPFHPRSPYGVAKVAAYHALVNYREAYGLFACNGILFNHESPHRGENFVTRKITIGAARIKEGLQKELRLGNLDARRDWGFAGDYVEAMWLMLQQEEPDDFVIATGETRSVREFLEIAFAAVDLDPEKHVRFDPYYTRPSEVHELCGDPAKAMRKLGWQPRTSFKELVHLMIENDLKGARRDRLTEEALKAADRHALTGT